MNDFERYFFSLDAEDKPLAVYRMISNSTVFTEEVWSADNWVPTDVLSEALINGSTRFEETTAEQSANFIAVKKASLYKAAEVGVVLGNLSSGSSAN